jgi:hypothetical protein
MALSLPKVVIRDATVFSRRVGENVFENQVGTLVLSEDEALGIEISLRRGRPPYAPGTYYLGGGSFDRDKYRRPCFSGAGLDLIPVPVQGAASAAK